MHRTLRSGLVVLVSLAATTLVGCSSTGAADAQAGPAQVAVAEPARASSLIADGAQVIDVQAADFHERIGRLDPDGTYVLYCRSGSRAAAAADMMADMGFADLVNAGGFDNLAAAGLPTEG